MAAIDPKRPFASRKSGHSVCALMSELIRKARHPAAGSKEHERETCVQSGFDGEIRAPLHSCAQRQHPGRTTRALNR